jgi:hypothetical protein
MVATAGLCCFGFDFSAVRVLLGKMKGSLQRPNRSIVLADFDAQSGTVVQSLSEDIESILGRRLMWLWLLCR